jgi:glyoxylase-like metal-dependent hydrolase (beta-lactamase superfamily II)
MAKPRVSEAARNVYALTIGRGALSTNVYLIRSGSSWTLVDAGWFGSEKKIRAAAESVFGPETRPTSMVLTHLHPDHSGATAALAERWGVPAALGTSAELACRAARSSAVLRSQR